MGHRFYFLVLRCTHSRTTHTHTIHIHRQTNTSTTINLHRWRTFGFFLTEFWFAPEYCGKSKRRNSSSLISNIFLFTTTFNDSYPLVSQSLSWQRSKAEQYYQRARVTTDWTYVIFNFSITSKLKIFKQLSLYFLRFSEWGSNFRTTDISKFQNCVYWNNQRWVIR